MVMVWSMIRVLLLVMVVIMVMVWSMIRVLLLVVVVIMVMIMGWSMIRVLLLVVVMGWSIIMIIMCRRCPVINIMIIVAALTTFSPTPSTPPPAPSSPSSTPSAHPIVHRMTDLSKVVAFHLFQIAQVTQASSLDYLGWDPPLKSVII